MMLMMLILYFAKALPEAFGLDRNAVIPHSDLALVCAEVWTGK